MGTIENFLGVYPDPSIEEERDFLAYDLFKKKELYDLKLSPFERVPDSPGKYLNHQKILSRIVSPYTLINKVLLFHGLGSGKCVHPQTKVLLDNKQEKTIESLFDKFKLLNSYFYDGTGYWYNLGETLTVKSLNLITNRLEDRPVEYIYKQYIQEEYIRKIKFSSNKIIKCTYRHKFLNSDNIWIYAGELKPGDKILNSNFKIIKVKSNRKSLYTGWVYDLQVKQLHNYIVENIISHNTCTSIAIEERRKQYLREKDFHLNRALVLVKGEVLIRNFRNELASKCTKRAYLPEEITTKAEVERKRNKLIKQNYELSTFGSFLNSLGNPGDSGYTERVRRKYNDTLIIVDEVHNLRIQPFKKESVSLYGKMHAFLHTVERTKILLLSATPIWDQTNEIASILNLLIPLNKQLPVGNNFDKLFFNPDSSLKEEAMELLKDRLRGHISYVRESKTTAKVIEEGQSKPWFKYLKVVPSVLSDFQADILSEATKKDRSTKRSKAEVLSGEKMGSFKKFSRQASNFVFPDGSYGQEGYEKYLNKKTLLIAKDREIIKDNLRNLSCKFYNVVKNIIDNPSQLSFVYTELVHGSGAILFGAILNLFGFKRATGRERNPQPGIRRYALITRATASNAEIESVKNIFNDPKNKDGDLIQVFIASRVAGQGITLMGVENIHILTPHWNLSETDQAIGRCLRLDSHLGVKFRRQITSSELGPEEAENPSLKAENPVVKIYRHVAVMGMNDPTETVDIDIYKMAENKDIKNQPIFRIIKEIAIDCPLTYRRNVLETDVDGSRDCDFTECNYVCDKFNPIIDPSTGLYEYNLPENKIDVSTYNLLYSQKKVRLTSIEIIRFILQHKLFYVGIDDIYRNFKDYDLFIILKSLDYLISRSTSINNIYGIPSYLKEDNGIIFLDTSIDIGRKASSSYYVENPYAIVKTELEDFIISKELSIDREKLKGIVTLPSSEEDLRELINSLYYPSKISLLEATYEKVQNNSIPENKKEKAKNILKILGNLIYEVETSAGKMVAHKMYIEEYKGRGYSIAKLKLRPTGKLRIWDKNRWRYATFEEEKEFNREVKTIIEERKKESLLGKENTWGYYGKYSPSENKFWIMVETKQGEREKKGIVCGTVPKHQLVSYALDIKFSPSKEQLEEIGIEHYGRQDLIKLINSAKGKDYERFKINLKNKTLKELKSLAYLLNRKLLRGKICVLLKDTLESKGFLEVI